MTMSVKPIYDSSEILEPSLKPHDKKICDMTKAELFEVRDELKAIIKRYDNATEYTLRLYKGKAHYYRRKTNPKTQKITESVVSAAEWRSNKIIIYRIKIYKSLLRTVDKMLQCFEHTRRMEIKDYAREVGRRRTYADQIAEIMKKVVAESQNPSYSEYLVLETARGEKVRSKSEVIIANALLARGVPYYYERALELPNGRVVYPDFTIIDTASGLPIYWEHFGLLDDMDYLRTARNKLIEYEKNGIVVNVNLMVTYDGVGENAVLNVHDVDRKIDLLLAA